MPAKGTTKLNNRKKAKILAEKQLGIVTVDQVAKQNGVVPNTVYRIEREATSELQSLADTYRERIIKRAKLNVERGLEVIGERIENPETHTKDVIGAVKLSHDIVQVQTGMPTSITQHQWTPERHALEFFKVLLAKESSFDKALAAFRQASLAPLVSDHTRDTVAVQVESNPKLLDGMTD
jgi:histone H3/H4